MMRLILTLPALVLIFSAGAFSQTADDTDLESFNDIQLTVPLGRRVDFQTAVAARIARDLTRFNDGRVQIGFVFKPTAKLSVTPFYWNIQARNATGRFRQEHRLNIRTAFRNEFKSFALVHRSTYEYRIRSSGNTWRYRAALGVEKELPAKILKNTRIIMSDEIFYDSATGRFSRNRVTAGITRQFTPKFGVELSFMHQNDGYAHPGDLNVVWLSWRIKL